MKVVKVVLLTQDELEFAKEELQMRLEAFQDGYDPETEEEMDYQQRLTDLIDKLDVVINEA